MSDLIIDRGLRDKILQPDWEDILGSIVSTTDIEDYGDYAIIDNFIDKIDELAACLLYTSPSPRDRQKSRMPSSA